MQVRLVAKQAPAIVWKHRFENSVSLATVLQEYCSHHGLSDQNAELTDCQGTKIALEEVAKASVVLLVHFQPTLRFFTWYCLYALCPQPLPQQWLDSFDHGGAANFAVDCAIYVTGKAALVSSLMPDQLLPHSCMPVSFTLDQQQPEAQTMLAVCMAFMRGLHRFVPGDTTSIQHPSCNFPRDCVTGALILVQQLHMMIQPLLVHSGQQCDFVLLEVMCLLLRGALPPDLMPQAAMLHARKCMTTDNAAGTASDAHLQAFVSSSLLWIKGCDTCPFRSGLLGSRDPTMQLVAVALQAATSSAVLDTFCNQGGPQCVARLLQSIGTARTIAYSVLDTLLHTAHSKGQLTCEQHQLLVEAVLLHLGPCLRPRYVIGEEAEAQKSQLVFGQSAQALPATAPETQRQQLQQTASYLLRFVRAQAEQQQRKTNYSLKLPKPLAMQLFLEQYHHYRHQPAHSPVPLPPALANDMDSLLDCILSAYNAQQPGGNAACSPLHSATASVTKPGSACGNDAVHSSAVPDTNLAVSDASLGSPRQTELATPGEAVWPGANQSATCATVPSTAAQAAEQAIVAPAAAGLPDGVVVRDQSSSHLSHGLASLPDPPTTAATQPAEPRSDQKRASAASTEAASKPDTAFEPVCTASGPTEVALNAVLATLANAGVHKMKSQHMYHQHWPTPAAATWKKISVKLATQAVTVLDWMLTSKVQLEAMCKHTLQASDAVQTSYGLADSQLKNTLIQLFHELVAGHIMDMSLDMLTLFQHSFHTIMQLWGHAEFIHNIPRTGGTASELDNLDATRILQLGRCMLTRLTDDINLMFEMFRGGTCSEDSLINGMKSICTVIGQSIRSPDEQGGATVQLHPDWPLLLEVAYVVVANPIFLLLDGRKKLVANQRVTKDLGQALLQLQPTSAAQQTAAALFCLLQATSIFEERDTQKKHKLCTALVQSEVMQGAMSVVHHAIVSSTYLSVEDCLPTLRLLTQFADLYQHLPEALQEELLAQPITRMSRPTAQADGAELDKAGLAVTAGYSIAQCMQNYHETAQEVQKEHKEAKMQPMCRKKWVSAALQYLKTSHLAAAQPRPPVQQRVFNVAAVDLLRAICPSAVFQRDEAPYMEYFTTWQATKLLPDSMKPWLDPGPEEDETSLATRAGSIIPKPELFVAQLLEYLQGTIMRPQYAHLSHMSYFGVTCFLSCMRIFTQQTKQMLYKAPKMDVVHDVDSPLLSPFAICLERHRLYMPAEILQGRSAIAAAAAPCLIWVWKLLLSLASFHAQQKAASMAALQAHKDYTRLLKAGDKFISDETEHNRLLDEAEDKRNFAHQERSSLQPPIDRANAELEKMLRVGKTLRSEPEWNQIKSDYYNMLGQGSIRYTNQLLAYRGLPKAKAKEIYDFFAPSSEWESQKGAAAEQILLAEAEQAEAKAALKRAKKQKQKARKSQQPSLLSSPTSDEASSSGTVPPSLHLGIPALDPTATSNVEELQQGLQQIRMGDDATFLAELFCCPLSKVLMVDPVIAADGHTYERAAIQEWLQSSSASPVTALPLPNTRLTLNVLVKLAIQSQMTD